MKFEMKFVPVRACRLPVQVFSMALALAFLLSLASSAGAQIVPCNPGPGGPPPGSIPRAIAKAPPLPIMPALPPNAPNPGAWLWILYDNRHLTLMHLPNGWPATAANQIVTINLDTLPGFGIPASYELYDVATGAGNTGLGIFYTTAWVVGRDPVTGGHRAQMVGMSPGTPPGGCFTFGALQTLNISPVAVGSVEYPQGYIANHFWSLEQTAAVEPGTSTPDQTITLRHLPTGGLPVLPPVDEDQILCAPGVDCPNWGDTLIEQLTGDAVHLLLRNQSTSAQSIGRLNLGNAGFGGFNSCAGSVNPCLYQRANLPAAISGNAIDIAGETFVPDRAWVLWAEEIAPASATPPGEDNINGPSASFESLAITQSAFTYKLGAINGNGSLLGSMTISTSGDSGGGGGGGSASGIIVTPPRIDFGATPVGGRGEGIYSIQNVTRGLVVISSMTFSDQTNSPFSLCEPFRIPFTLQPQQQRDFRVCFRPTVAGAFQNSIVIMGSNPHQVIATVPLTGQGILFRQDGCTVKITGPSYVCHTCDSNAKSIKLTATGAPKGGAYKWEVITGKELVELTPRDNTAFVKGKKPSEKKEDVEIKVTYTVEGKECSDTHKLTVGQPAKLKVVADWQFIVSEGQVTSTTKDGKIFTGRLPADVQTALNQTLKDAGKRSGAILIRFYEVLDQFGDKWPCDGKLEEEITSSGSVQTGGSDVKDGVVKNPDRLFHLEMPFKSVTLLQVIRVSGCVVRYNKITINADGVTVTELTKEKYEEELQKMKKK
jgi:hypothetical protein